MDLERLLYQAGLLKLRLGIIGIGAGWRSRHAPALRMLHDRFDVRAVFSPTVRLAENAATEFQADVVDGYRALVSRCDIDAVLILEKTWLGLLPMIASAESGKAIYWAGSCDFDPIQDAAARQEIEASGVSMMVEFSRRYWPATLRLKELIATRLGKPTLVFCHRRLPAVDAASIVNSPQPISMRSELLELTDWCQYIVGMTPTEVMATGHRDTAGNWDYRSIHYRYSGAEGSAPVVAQVTCSSYLSAKFSEANGYQSPSAMQITCENGVAFLDPPSTLVWFDEAGRHRESLESETPVGQQLLSQFFRSVTGLLRNVGDLDDAFLASQLLHLADQSEAKGRRMKVGEEGEQKDEDQEED